MRSISKLPIPVLLTIKKYIQFLFSALVICSTGLAMDKPGLKNELEYINMLGGHLDPSAIVGTLEDLLLAAEEDRQPVYFSQLMDILYRKLFVLENKIETEQEAQVYAYTMCKIFDYLYSYISKAVLSTFNDGSGEFPKRLAVYRTLTPSWRAVRAMMDFATYDNNVRISNEISLSEFDKALRAAETAIDAAKNTRFIALNCLDSYKKTYLIAEWAFLNYFCQNVEAFIGIFRMKKMVFTSAQPNTFSDKKSFMASYQSRFGSLHPNDLLFIVPWLLQIPVARELWSNVPTHLHRQVFLHFSELNDN